MELIESYNFTDVYDFLRHYSINFLKLSKQKTIKTNNKRNIGTLKEELVEIPHQFFGIKNPTKIIFNLKNYNTRAWWLVGEILTDFLVLNPPLMSKYRPDIIQESYKLNPQGFVTSLYGGRWFESNQFENVRKRLIDNPTSKRCVITTFQPNDSAPHLDESPCNVNYMFLGRDGKLDMTASIRSNDFTRGTKYDYPLASFVLQNMASWTNMEVGQLYFYINSLHVYKKDIANLEKVVKELEDNMSKPVELLLPNANVNVESFYEDLRRVKKAEDAAYNGNWEYCDRNINLTKYMLYRDFGRVLKLKNARLPYKNEKEEKKTLDDFEWFQRDWVALK